MQEFQLYNTLTRKIEPIVPRSGNHLGFYACGITAYDYSHIGHLRRYIMDDVLIRALRYHDYEVKFVQNVTDVGHLTSDADEGEDKLELGARRHHDSVLTIARKYEDYFYNDNRQVGNLPPDVITRATAYIDQQLQIAIALEKKGYAYLIPHEGLYFDTSKVPHYGELAGLNINQLKEGARVEVVAGKRNPTDFAVWKLEKPHENRQMVWPSPWGERSFPGWHLECVAMSIDQLGEQFEIHTGGVDHIPVHHTNEIAQAEAYTGKRPFVQTWIHHNFIRIDGQKMSKSLGNLIKLEDIVAKGFSPFALRYLFLTAHYRKELNFTYDSLSAAAKAYDHLIATLAVFRTQKTAPMEEEEHLTKNQQYRERFLTAISHDLDTPKALTIIGEITKINLGPGGRYDLIIELDNILGLNLRRQTEHYLKAQSLTLTTTPDEEAKKLLQMRQDARANQDFARADYLRQRLINLGYQIIDTKNGAKVKKIHDNNSRSRQQ